MFTAFLLALGASAADDSVRYFAIWSYAENEPLEEIEASDLADRKLGWWELHFGPEGAVIEGIYHSSVGAPWLKLRYVEVDERIYADVYLADDSFIVRKSTQLENREPHWPAATGGGEVLP